MGRVKSSSCLTLSSLSLDEMANGIDGNHLVVVCNIIDNQVVIKTHTLIDSGATGYAFIDEDFTRRNNLPLYALKEPRSLTVIDGRPISSDDITHLTKIGLTINNHQETIPAYVTKLGGYPLTLGIPWLRQHNVSINFAADTLTFESDYCLKNCTSDITWIHGIEEEIPHFLSAFTT